MKLGSLFTGVGGIDLAFQRKGVEIAFQVEVDKYCQKVLEKHFPGVQRFGDITQVRVEDLEPVDILAGGFPCQDLSVAGKRQGLAGSRSGLWWEFQRIIEGLQPRYVVIENVPGLLTSNRGLDFHTLLREMVQLRYGVEWRVLNAEYFGVPQPRRRVFLVGHYHPDTRGTRQILSDTESCLGDDPPHQATTTQAAGGDEESSVGVVASRGYTDRVANTLTATDYKGPSSYFNGYFRNCQIIDGLLRRVMPIEAERIQGFPDNWTEGVSDLQRYKMMGNAVAVPVVSWIAEQLLHFNDKEGSS